MSLDNREALGRIRASLSAVAPDLTLDAASVRWVDAPYPGVAYGVGLGEARALLFLPVGDIDGEGWEERIRARLLAARAYLEHFPLSRVRR